MKHKVKVMVEVEKPGLFGKKKVLEERTIVVDGKTYRKLMDDPKKGPLTIDEILFYDDDEIDW